jgi:hypothetical protein
MTNSDDALLFTGGAKPACVTRRGLASAGRCLGTSDPWPRCAHVYFLCRGQLAKSVHVPRARALALMDQAIHRYENPEIYLPIRIAKSREYLVAEQ